MGKFNPLKVTCIGGGIIGASWATEFLWNGKEVVVQDINEKGLKNAAAHIKSNLEFLVEKSIISSHKLENCLSNIKYTTDMKEALKDAEFIQESAFENYDVKKEIIRQVDEFAPSAIYASSSSGLLISEIQKYSEYPERCVTAHPFNPPHLIPLVEIVKGEHTTNETAQKTFDFFEAIGKEPIIVEKEVPGHVANRIQMAVFREAADMVMNGVCSVEDVDKALSYGPGLRYALMGQIQIWDLASETGIDGTIDHLGESMHLWLDDMATWKKIPENLGKILEEGLSNVEGRKSSENIKSWRDAKLVNILEQLNKI